MTTDIITRYASPYIWSANLNGKSERGGSGTMLLPHYWGVERY